MTTPRIWLIRHGQTEWSRDGRHTGSTDLPLTPKGEEEADAIRAELVGVDPGLVLCSPLLRARETAQRAGLRPDGISDDLVEWDYGAWEGRTTADIRIELADPRWLIWDHPVPVGATPGEQLPDVAARVDRVIARCQPVLDSGRDCVLVAHGHVLRILTARWLGQPPIDGRLYALDPARLSALGYEHETKVILCWNATTAERAI
jgi:broad specificity phosphatase PhoE